VKLSLVWNPRAGRADDRAREHVLTQLGRLGDATFRPVRDRLGPDACAREAVADGADVVVAAGGDGTVSAVAAALIGSPARLAVLPMGTSNSFAAALAIPDDLDGAIAALGAGHARVIDLARVTTRDGARVMVLHCMVGFHADTIERTAPEAKRRWGALAYVASAVRELAALAPFAATLDAGSDVVRCRAAAIAVTNVAPVKTVLAQGPSRLPADHGCVEITIVAMETIAEAIATGIHLLVRALEGAPADRPNVGSFSARRVTITTDPTQRVVVDGESAGLTPVTIDALPRALTVVAPPPRPDEALPVEEAPLAGLPDLVVEHR
jgi:YegS/Rv2252/BmrU family lipid kinase